MAVLLLLATFSFPIATTAGEFASDLDKVVGVSVDALTEVDQVTGQISLNLTRSKDAYEKGLARFQERDLQNQSEGVFPLPASHPKYLRVKSLYDKVLAVSHYKDQENLMLGVYQSPGLNYYATGGGHIGIYSGLLDSSTDGEVAYFIAYALAQNAAAHSFEREAHVRLNKKSEIKQGYVEVFTNLNVKEADSIAILYMTLAGFDPYSSVTTWAKKTADDDSKYGRFATLPPNRERASLNAQTAQRVRQYLKLGMKNPEADEILKCNVLFCNQSSDRIADGKGGGILKLLELARVTKGTYAEGKDEYHKQRRNMAYANAPSVRMPLGWVAFRGILELGDHPLGISFGLSNSEGVFYYKAKEKIRKGTLAYYGTNDDGYWFQWWGFSG